MKSLALGAALAIAAAVGAGGAAQAALTAEDKLVTLTGCVVKGDGGYVLMPLPEHGGAAAALPPAGTGGETTGTTGHGPEMIRVLYWLEDDDEVDDHAGQRVEITGEVEGDIDTGEITVEREDDGTVELEFKHEGKTIGVKLPDIAGTIGTAGGAITDEERDYDVAVRKVDVKSVKMLASACQ
jgi:hypothetical protein